MRQLFLTGALAAIAGGSGATAAAAATITSFPLGNGGEVAGFTTTAADAFDVSGGAQVTAVNGATVFPASNAIGGVTPDTGEPNNLVFDTFAVQGFTFRTAAPVAIGGFDLYLADDDDGAVASRGYSSVTVRGSSDGVTFVDLDSAVIPGTSYSAAFGSRALRVSSRFAAPVTYQFFQFEGVQRQGGFFAGGRVLELDAVAAQAAGVPEPATWGLMLAGFGLVCGALRRRRVPVAFA